MTRCYTAWQTEAGYLASFIINKWNTNQHTVFLNTKTQLKNSTKQHNYMHVSLSTYSVNWYERICMMSAVTECCISNSTLVNVTHDVTLNLM